MRFVMILPTTYNQPAAVILNIACARPETMVSTTTVAQGLPI